jgi:hypothetical protein
VFKQAPLAIWAKQPIIECRARFGFVLVIINRRCLAHEFVLPVSELALRPVSTEAHLDPILAHLGLVFGLVYLQLLCLIREERLCI